MTNRDAVLLKLKRLTKALHRSIADHTWDNANEIQEQIEGIFDGVSEIGPSFSPIFLDAANACAKSAIYHDRFILAEIHLSFVSDVCLSRAGGNRTTQFADCLECYSRIAMKKAEWDDFAVCLEQCAEIRLQVLGHNHPDTLRAKREWETLLDIMTDPKLDSPQTCAVSHNTEATKN